MPIANKRFGTFPGVPRFPYENCFRPPFLPTTIVGLSFSPLVAGFLLSSGPESTEFSLPFFLAGGLKIACDILLWLSFKFSSVDSSAGAPLPPYSYPLTSSSSSSSSSRPFKLIRNIDIVSAARSLSSRSYTRLTEQEEQLQQQHSSTSHTNVEKQQLVGSCGSIAAARETKGGDNPVTRLPSRELELELARFVEEEEDDDHEQHSSRQHRSSSNTEDGMLPSGYFPAPTGEKEEEKEQRQRRQDHDYDENDDDDDVLMDGRSSLCLNGSGGESLLSSPSSTSAKSPTGVVRIHIAPPPPFSSPSSLASPGRTGVFSQGRPVAEDDYDDDDRFDDDELKARFAI